MRIALVVPGGVDPSGVYRVIPALLALIRRLSAHHEVRVFALNQEPSPARWELLGAQVENIGRGHTRTRCVLAIRAAHRVRRFDLIHAIWSASPGLVAVAAARMLGVPSLVHVTGGELVSIPGIAYGGRLTWKGCLREAAVLRAASQVTATSRPMISALAALGIPARRVPLGVDLEAWPAREPEARAPRRPARLVHVASLNRVKDQGTLLQALAVLRRSGVQFEMHIVGEDTLGGEVQSLAQRLDLSSHITFHGFLPQHALRPVVAAADLMILSSLHEAGPAVMHEAAVLGVPTVGTAVGHVAEWAPEAALAAPTGEPIQLAHQVTAVLEDEPRRLRLASAAHALAVREDADYTARTFEAIYESLLARG